MGNQTVSPPSADFFKRHSCLRLPPTEGAATAGSNDDELAGRNQGCKHGIPW
jgi:hypothetical protein